MNTCRAIAVIDDEDSVRKALERVLRACGVSVVTYPGGSEFLEALQTFRPECVLLDLHMPKISGFELLEILVGAPHRLPVVVITGHDSPDARARALAAGASAYLTKPIDDQLLLSEIAAALDRRGGR